MIKKSARRTRCWAARLWRENVAITRKACHTKRSSSRPSPNYELVDLKGYDSAQQRAPKSPNTSLGATRMAVIRVWIGSRRTKSTSRSLPQKKKPHKTKSLVRPRVGSRMKFT